MLPVMEVAVRRLLELGFVKVVEDWKLDVLAP